MPAIRSPYGVQPSKYSASAVGFEELAQCIRLSHYRESVYALIASYMDESVDEGKTGVFVVGGLMGRGVPLFELDRKWEKLLKRPDIDIPYFKASECKNGRGQFAKFVAIPGNPTPSEHEKLDSISNEFLSLIPQEEHIIVQGVGIEQSDFYEVIEDANARAVLGGSPYRLAYDLAMMQCAWAMKQLEEDIKREKAKLMSTGPSRVHVSFVCDEHEEYSPLANEAYRNLKNTNPSAGQYMATFTSADDRSLCVLQAADAVVFEIRRVLNLVLGNYSKGVLRKQFSILADPGKIFLITHTNKEHLLKIVATHKRGEPFKLDDIMDHEIAESIRFTI